MWTTRFIFQISWYQVEPVSIKNRVNSGEIIGKGQGGERRRAVSLPFAGITVKRFLR